MSPCLLFLSALTICLSFLCSIFFFFVCVCVQTALCIPHCKLFLPILTDLLSFFKCNFYICFCTLVQAQNRSNILGVSREFLCKVRNHLLNRDKALNKFRARLDVESTLNRRHACQCYTDIKGQIKTKKNVVNQVSIVLFRNTRASGLPSW